MHKPFYSNQKEMWEPLSYNIFIAGLFLNPLAFENSRRSVVQSPAPSVSNLKWPWTVNVLWSHKCCTKACYQTGCFFVIINKWTSNPTWVNIKEKNFCYFYVSMYENPLIEKWLVFLVKIWKLNSCIHERLHDYEEQMWDVFFFFFYWCDKNCGDYF